MFTVETVVIGHLPEVVPVGPASDRSPRHNLWGPGTWFARFGAVSTVLVTLRSSSQPISLSVLSCVALVHWFGLAAGSGLGWSDLSRFCGEGSPWCGRDLGAGFGAVTWCSLQNPDGSDILMLLSDPCFLHHCVLVSPGRFCRVACGLSGICLIVLNRCSIVTAGSRTFCLIRCGLYGIYLRCVCDLVQRVSVTCLVRLLRLPGSLRTPRSLPVPRNQATPLPGAWTGSGGCGAPEGP